MVVPEGVVALGGEDGRVAGKPGVAGVAGEEGVREDVAEGGVAADVIGVGVGDQGQRDLLRPPPQRLDRRQVDCRGRVGHPGVDQRQSVAGEQVERHRLGANRPVQAEDAWRNLHRTHVHMLPLAISISIPVDA